MQSKKTLYLWIILWTGLAIIGLIFTQATGDHGDSIMHYLFARYAHLHPENFLNPWAKTGFTLIAWPFAQFGLKGMMVMNIFFVIANMLLIKQVAERLGIKYPIVASVIMSLCTAYFTLMYSGLTEHAFSFILLLSIYLLLSNRWIIGTILLSALPFFRQEGYIIIASLLPFYLMSRKLKLIPLLSFAFVIIAIIGAVYYHNLFWIIDSNPYSTSNIYGSGSVFTFFNHLYYHHGLVNLIFFLLGIVTIFLLPVKSMSLNKSKIILLIFLPYVSFFISHVLFWSLGLFNSAGLQRVLNCTVPLFAIIAAVGFSKLNSIFSNKLTRRSYLFFLAIIVFFPLLPSPANINFNRDFKRASFDSDVYHICAYINTNYKSRYIYFEHPLVALYLDIDPFDVTKCERLINLNNHELKKGAVIFWESGLTKVHTGISESSLLSDQRLYILKDTTTIVDPHRIIVAEVK